MGLYLCIFDGDDELDGVEVGSYADFGALRDYVQVALEGGHVGTRFPTFILHSDCDGVWTPEECAVLETELATIVAECKERPPVAFHSPWQRDVARSIGLVPRNAHESFIDVDGELLLDRFLGLVSIARKRAVPIVFQ